MTFSARWIPAAVWLGAAATLVAAGLWIAEARRPGLSRALPPLGTSGAPGTARADLDRTIEAMDARLARRPDDGAAAVTLADALIRQTRVTGNAGLAIRAESALTIVLKSEPMDYDARRMLAAVYLSQHRFRDAIREAVRCQQTRANDAWTFGVLGDAHLELGDYDAAFEVFDRMAALKPNAASYARASYARELQGDLTGALRLMQMSAEATAPQDQESLAWHYAQIGHLQFDIGDLDAARRAYEHADFVFPGHPFAADGLARVEAARGHQAAALDIVLTRLTRAPSPEDAAFAGDLLEQLGRHDAAERQYMLAEAGWRVDAPDPAKLARFLAEHHRHVDEAVRLAEDAAAVRHDIFTDDALAWAYFAQGRIADAQAAIARAIRTGTHDRDIRRHAAAIAAASANRVARR
jgi:tetratricopeptide (TPR) repeat protein